MKRIHIVGSGPRTGTTLLFEAMTTCFDINHFCEHESSLLSEQPNGDGIFLTKKPGEFMSVRWPLFFDKKLYVICLVRDPRDTIVSKHNARPNEYWTGLRSWVKFVKVYKKLRTHKRFIVIRYEDFVSQPDRTQDYIACRIPFLKKKYNFSDYHLVATPSENSLKAMKNIRPIEAKSIGKWRDHLPRVKQQISLHGPISDSLIDFGYEGDRKWETLIEKVKNRDFNGKKPEFFSWKVISAKHKVSILVSLSVILEKFGINRNILFKIRNMLLRK